MEKQIKKRIINISLAVISTISVVLNVFLINECNKLINQVKNNVSQTLDDNETSIEEKADNKQQEDKKIEKEDKKEEQKIEYVYKYIEGEEKQVLVEKEVEVPALSTDAIVTYVDSEGNTKNIELSSGTTINFSAGEHGSYDSIPASITLTDNQEVDITDISYEPTSVETNYIFKGFSYSGNTIKCEYSLADNIVNVESKQIANTINKNGIIYIKHDYLESTGSQYINTGVKFDANDYNGEVDFQYTNAIGNTWLFGAVNSSYVGCEAGLSGANTFYTEAGFSYSQSNPSLRTVGTFTTASVAASNNNFYLFARNAPLPSYIKGKVFSCKIRKGSELKADLIPTEKAIDGKTGMLNLVNGAFLENAGSGSFIHPDAVLISGINAGKVIASGSYETGSDLSLTAIANDGYVFVRWFDGDTNATKTITIGNSTTYTALFAEE